MSMYDRGRVSQSELEKLQRNRDLFLVAFSSEDRQLSAIDRSIARHRISIAWARLRLRGRQRCRGLVERLDRSVTRTGGVLIAASLAMGATAIIGFNLGGKYDAPALGLVSFIAILIIAWICAMKLPSDEILSARIARAHDSISELRTKALAVNAEFANGRRQRELLANEPLQTERPYYSRESQLLECRWRGFTGIKFEKFLVLVFSELGYRVQATKSSGDHGVDLVVVGRGRRLAIQAKGYTSSSVGNHAVMEVHAGKSHYKCDGAIVVTNSVFTPAARVLAESVGCMLIDEGSIPALIRGELAL